MPMSPFVKFILDYTVLPADKALVAVLQAQEGALVAEAQTLVASGTAALPAVVTTLLSRVSNNPLVVMAEDAFLPNIESALTTELGTLASADIPTLVTSGIRFFQNQEAYL